MRKRSLLCQNKFLEVVQVLEPTYMKQYKDKAELISSAK